ncbi:MAG: GNAT family N-acetyltransferase [Eubacteriales bacterium]|nr:GNAT family N-acetyltransferase [Eubacteriales bacterium]
MTFERLRARGGALYDEAMKLYRESFPRHEQREPLSQGEIMGREDYQFNVIREDGDWAGLLLCWETETFLYVEHFCVRPELRGRGCGARALALLKERGKTVILEIDPPVDEVSIRRKGFYERAGFCENAFAHVHPPYHSDCAGHELVVLSCPGALTKDEYERFGRYLRETVMGR